MWVTLLSIASLHYFKMQALLEVHQWWPDLFGWPRPFVTLAWVCKKQTAVSHPSAEAEIISFDAGLRLEGIPSLTLWDQIVEVFSPHVMNNVHLRWHVQ